MLFSPAGFGWSGRGPDGREWGIFRVLNFPGEGNGKREVREFRMFWGA